MYLKLVLLILVFGISSDADAHDLSERPKIRVQLSNDAAVSSSIVVDALKECSRIFQNAGIDIDWSLDPSSQPYDFLVNIVRAPSPGVSGNALGYVSHDSQRSSAVVVWPRVSALRSYHTVAFEVLGRVIAHELGHLLLGQPRHSAYGIMRALWSVEDLRIENANLFQFTKQDLKQIRKNLSQHRETFSSRLRSGNSPIVESKSH